MLCICFAHICLVNVSVEMFVCMKRGVFWYCLRRRLKIIVPEKECEVFRMARKTDLMLKNCKTVIFLPKKKTTYHLQICYSHLLTTSLIGMIPDLCLNQSFPSPQRKQQFSKFGPELFKAFMCIVEMANPKKTVACVSVSMYSQFQHWRKCT